MSTYHDDPAPVRAHPRLVILRLLAALDREDRDERLRASRLPGAGELLAMAKSRRLLAEMRRAGR